MSDAFVAYIRHAEKVLLMQRADEVSDFAGAWDGVYGLSLIPISEPTRLRRSAGGGVGVQKK